jgi:transcriptional regulator with XRE-family HTH domain
MAPRGTRIRELRVDKGLTLMQLAQLTGYSIGHLSDIECGKMKAGTKLVVALAQVYGLENRTIRRYCAEAVNGSMG